MALFELAKDPLVKKWFEERPLLKTAQLDFDLVKSWFYDLLSHTDINLYKYVAQRIDYEDQFLAGIAEDFNKEGTKSKDKDKDEDDSSLNPDYGGLHGGPPRDQRKLTTFVKEFLEDLSRLVKLKSRDQEFDQLVKLISQANDHYLPNTILKMVGCYLIPDFRPVFIDQWLEIRDYYGIWIEAQVREIDFKNYRFKIHYKAWNIKSDEWLSYKVDSDDSARIRLYNNSPDFNARWKCRGEETKPYELSEGEAVYCLDTIGIAIEATVKEIILFNNGEVITPMIYINYTGWDPFYNEWIPIDSYRLLRRVEQDK